jgi:hypothetical protein
VKAKPNAIMRTNDWFDFHSPIGQFLQLGRKRVISFNNNGTVGVVPQTQIDHGGIRFAFIQDKLGWVILIN